MIKASELRLNNYYNYQGKQYQVGSFDSDSISPLVDCCKKVISNNKHFLNLKALHFEGLVEGIPLTEEWLVKFGLNTTDKFFECTNAEFKIGVLRDVFLYLGNKGMYLRIEYVHQLQNLYFALTGQELEINDN